MSKPAIDEYLRQHTAHVHSYPNTVRVKRGLAQFVQTGAYYQCTRYKLESDYFRESYIYQMRKSVIEMELYFFLNAAKVIYASGIV